jgi:hypothetical protein
MKIYSIETSVVSGLMASIIENKSYLSDPVYAYFKSQNIEKNSTRVELKICSLYIKGLLNDEFNKPVDNFAKMFYRECLDLVDFEVVAAMLLDHE